MIYPQANNASAGGSAGKRAGKNSSFAEKRGAARKNGKGGKPQQVVQWKQKNVEEGLVVVDELQLSKLIKREAIEKHYRLDPEPFATGQFASVRRCVSLDTGEVFAAKFSSRARYGEDCSAEIHHEIALLSLCAPSPRIVKLHDVYETPTEIIILMQFAPGGDLQTVIDDNLVPFETDVVNFVRQLVEGLAYLHERKIAHLDIKPQNLVMMGDFPNCDVKLCDFEISRVILEGTEIREILGTPDYVAPEILHYEPITLAADLWSLGVTTYVLLTGFSPFGGETDQETFSNISRAQLDFPEELFEDVSHDAQDFIRQLLVREPGARPSAKSLLRHRWLSRQTAPRPPPAAPGGGNLRKYLSKSREALFERVVQQQDLRKTALLSQYHKTRMCESHTSLVSRTREERPLVGLSPSFSRSREKLYGLRSLSRSHEGLDLLRLGGGRKAYTRATTTELAMLPTPDKTFRKINSDSSLVSPALLKNTLRQCRQPNNIADDETASKYETTLAHHIQLLRVANNENNTDTNDQPRIPSVVSDNPEDQVSQVTEQRATTNNSCIEEQEHKITEQRATTNNSCIEEQEHKITEQRATTNNSCIEEQEHKITEQRATTNNSCIEEQEHKITKLKPTTKHSCIEEQEHKITKLKLTTNNSCIEAQEHKITEQVPTKHSCMLEQVSKVTELKPISERCTEDQVSEVTEPGVPTNNQVSEVTEPGVPTNNQVSEVTEAGVPTNNSRTEPEPEPVGCTQETPEEAEEPSFTVAQLISAYNRHQEVVTKTSLEVTMTTGDKTVVVPRDPSTKFPTGPTALRLFIPDIDIETTKKRKNRTKSYRTLARSSLVADEANRAALGRLVALAREAGVQSSSTDSRDKPALDRVAGVESRSSDSRDKAAIDRVAGVGSSSSDSRDKPALDRVAGVGSSSTDSRDKPALDTVAGVESSSSDDRVRNLDKPAIDTVAGVGSSSTDSRDKAAIDTVAGVGSSSSDSRDKPAIDRVAGVESSSSDDRVRNLDKPAIDTVAGVDSSGGEETCDQANSDTDLYVCSFVLEPPPAERCVGPNYLRSASLSSETSGGLTPSETLSSLSWEDGVNARPPREEGVNAWGRLCTGSYTRAMERFEGGTKPRANNVRKCSLAMLFPVEQDGQEKVRRKSTSVIVKLS